jgi:O-antigen/teichoic acid export membrane protein
LTEPELEPTNLSETVVRGMGLAGAGYVLAQVITLGFYLALSRLATPADFGEFAAGALVVTVGLIFTESGMLAALIHRPDPIDAAASTAVIATCLAGLGLSLGALAAAPILGHFFDDSTIGAIAAAMSGLLMLRSIMVVPEALLQRRFSFLRRVVIEPAGAIALGVAAVIACANGLGPWGLVIGYYAAAAVDVLLSWGLVRWRPRLRLASLAMWRELIRYGRFIVATNIIARLGEQVPTLLLGRFVGTNALGQYRYGDRMVSTPLSLVVQGGSYVLFPAFARITDDRARFRAAALRSFGLMCALAFPLGLLLVPLGVPAAVLLFGEPWRDAGYAAMALAMVPVAGTPISFASEALKADGKPDILARVHIIMAVSSTVAMVALLPLGLVGVAAGISIGMSVAAGYAMVRTSKLVGFSIEDVAQAVALPAVAAALMVAVLTPIEFLVVDAASRPLVPALLLLSAETLAGLGIYYLALRIIAPRTALDLTSLTKRLLRRAA